MNYVLGVSYIWLIPVIVQELLEASFGVGRLVLLEFLFSHK